MNHRIAATGLAACLSLVACAGSIPPHAEPAAPVVAHPPSSALLDLSPLPYHYPRFDQIHDADFIPAFEAGMSQGRAEIDRIAGSTEAPTFDNTIVALENSGRPLGRVSAIFFNLVAANTNPQLDKVQAEIVPRLSAYNDATVLDARLYARIKTLYDARAQLGLDPESLRLLERYHVNFVRAGAELAESDKTQLRDFNERLAKLTTQFEQNLLKENNDSAVLVKSRDELAGLDAATIAGAAEAAKAKGYDGQYLIGLQNTTGQPVLTDLKNRALRERILKASLSRANRDNDNDNKAVIASIVALRAQRARLLGYPSHAAYQLEDSTARTTTAVNQLLHKLAPPAVANARREAVDLQKIIDRQKGGFKLAAWDWAYYAEALRKQQYNLDESQIRPYFELDNVLQKGVFFAAHELYGLSFKERFDLPKYHPDIRTFEVFNADGSTLGLFIFDPFKRESKRGGAWMNSYIDQSDLFGTQAVVANHLNIPKPPAGEPVLLTSDEVKTAFHEFGHAMHGLFSKVRYPLFSGTSVPSDFVEYPSQANEMWATWPSVLANYAHHYKTGAPMPKKLVDKIKAAAKFDQGFTTTEYLAAALLDQAWHQLPVDKAQVTDVNAFEKQALAEAGVDYAPVPPRYRSTYFSHVFPGGYSASYYAYIWSEVLVADTGKWFEEKGGLTRANGDWYREHLLSRGGSVEAMDLYRDFRGRDPEIGPLLERRGLLPATQAPAHKSKPKARSKQRR